MENKGITLVALVVTIIIMLILAGVTLRLTLGDNGLIKKAKETTEEYEDAMHEVIGNDYTYLGVDKYSRK